MSIIVIIYPNHSPRTFTMHQIKFAKNWLLRVCWEHWIIICEVLVPYRNCIMWCHSNHMTWKFLQKLHYVMPRPIWTLQQLMRPWDQNKRRSDKPTLPRWNSSNISRLRQPKTLPPFLMSAIGWSAIWETVWIPCVALIPYLFHETSGDRNDGFAQKARTQDGLRPAAHDIMNPQPHTRRDVWLQYLILYQRPGFLFRPGTPKS